LVTLIEQLVNVPNSVVGHFAHKCLWFTVPHKHNNLDIEKSLIIIGTVTAIIRTCFYRFCRYTVRYKESINTKLWETFTCQRTM